MESQAVAMRKTAGQIAPKLRTEWPRVAADLLVAGKEIGSPDDRHLGLTHDDSHAEPWPSIGYSLLGPGKPAWLRVHLF